MLGRLFSQVAGPPIPVFPYGHCLKLEASREQQAFPSTQDRIVGLFLDCFLNTEKQSKDRLGR